MDVHMDVHMDVLMDVHHDKLWVSKIIFFKSSGDRFFDPKSLSIDLLVMVPEFFDVTFDRFFSGSPKRSKMAKYGQKGPIVRGRGPNSPG